MERRSCVWVLSRGMARACATWFCLVLSLLATAGAEEILLPSWNDGAARTAILAFLERTTTPGSPDFLAPSARIAVFDNDGTLWPETPLPFQAQFVLDELKRLEGDHPEWKENPAITAALATLGDKVINAADTLLVAGIPILNR